MAQFPPHGGFAPEGPLFHMLETDTPCKGNLGCCVQASDEGDVPNDNARS